MIIETLALFYLALLLALFRGGSQKGILAIIIGIISYVYCIAFIAISASEGDWANGLYGYTLYQHDEAAIYASGYVVMLLIGAGFACQIIPRRITDDTEWREGSSTYFWIVWGALFCFSIYKLTSKLGQASNISQRGAGFEFILGYASFFLPVIQGLRSTQNGRIWRLAMILVASVPSMAFFFAAGQRGGAFYPLVLGLISAFGFPRRVGWKLTALLSTPFLMVFANKITSQLRAAYRDGDIFTLDLFDNAKIGISNSFSHGEMLAAVIRDKAELSTPVFFNSLINWLPSKFFEKGLTAGPEMAVYFLDDVSRYWHSTSLTTGPLVEGYLYFGWFGLSIGAMHGFFVLAIHRAVTSVCLKIGLLWLFCFQIFFDDMGGVVNKLVLLLISYSLIVFGKSLLFRSFHTDAQKR